MEQNLNLYQIFYEVANCRNFSVAARKLYISQPAISKSISKLEEGLHTVLFHRSSRGVILTPDGELLFRHVEKAMLSLQSGTEQLKAAHAKGSCKLSIGVSTTLCKYILLPLLKNFIAANPNIKITIACQSTYENIAALNNGTIDIGFVSIPSASSGISSGMSYLPLKVIEDIFVAAEAYLAPFNDYFKEASFIMLNKENISRKHAEAFLSEHQITVENIIEVNNMDLSVEFARAGLGIACVISDFVREDLKNGTLCELKLKHKIPKRQIGFAYSTRQPVSTGMNTLIQYYQTHL